MSTPNPDDLDALLVWADALQAAGDPLGELVALSVRGEADPDAAAQAEALRASLAAGWLPKLTAAAEADDGYTLELGWRRGLIVRARLGDYYDAEPKTAELLTEVLACPAAALVELAIGLADDEGQQLYKECLTALADARPPHLRRLFIGDAEYNGAETEISWMHLGDVSALWDALPGLTALRLRGNVIVPEAPFAMPNLRSLIVETGGLPASTARALGAGGYPQLEELELWFGQRNYEGDTTLDDVMPLLLRTDLPHLWRLALKNGEFGDDLASVLGASPLASQARVLELSMSVLTDAGAASLAGAVTRLPKLERLDVSECYLTAAGITALQAAFGDRVTAGDQRTPSHWGGQDHYYAAVGE